MTHIFLVRHGETDANLQKRLLGEADPPLNFNGRKQLLKTKKFLQDRASIQLSIVSSPKLRAIETANILVGRRQISFRECIELSERKLGPYDGMGVDELIKLRREKGHFFQDPTQDWESIDEVESDACVSARALSLLENINPRDSIIMVSHAGVIKSVFHTLFDVPASRRAVLKIRNGGVLWVKISDNGKWNLEGLFNPG